MTQAFEMTRPRRMPGRVPNGKLRAHANHVRADVAALQSDLAQLRSDVGTLVTMQWRALGNQLNDGVTYVGEQIRTRPVASLGVAAGVGMLAALIVSSLNRRRH